MTKATSLKAKIGLAIAAVATPLSSALAAATDTLQNIKDQANNTSLNAGLPSTTGSNNFAAVVGKLIGSALGLLGIILVVIIIYAGFLWMTAQGAEDKVKTAKTMIKNAIIGMILIFTASAITNFVLNNIITTIVNP